MNKKRKFRIKEYIGTVIFTIVLVLAICLYVELDLLFATEYKVNNRELDTANLKEFCKIEQLEKILLREPKNYIVAIRLAKNYENLEEFTKANNLYSDAVKISKNSPYSMYSYAMFLARRGIYGLSTELAENLSLQNKKTFEYRTDIYEELAKNLNKNNEFEAEVKAYQIAQKYAKNTKDNKVLDRINEGYSKAYINLADYHVNNKEIDNAILDLKNSLKIKESSIAKYKLALIYENIDKVKAEHYFGDVMVEDIYLLNPYIYHKLLEDLIEESKVSMNTHSADFYILKLAKLKRLMQTNYVFKNEVLISNFHIIQTKKMLSKKGTYSMYFDILNNTKVKLNKLYIQVELFANNKQYVLKKQAVSSINTIMPYETLEQVKIPLPDDFELGDIKNQNNVTVKYYAKKRTKAPWTLLKIESVKF